MSKKGLLNILPTVNQTGWPWDTEINSNLYKESVDWPKISIVTPSYNQGLYIEETIRSILLQNYPNLEFIVIDGGSKDETVNILKKYDSWITHWESEKDRGQSHAINKGINKCSGYIFNWINSDDVLAEKSLYHVALEFNKKSSFAVAGYMQMNRLTGVEIHKGTHLYNSLGKTIGDSYLNQPSTFFLLDFIQSVGVNEALHYTMDVELYIKFFLLHGVNSMKKVNHILSIFRYHDGSKTNNAVDEFYYDKAKIFHSICCQINLKKESDKLIQLYPNLADGGYNFNFDLDILNQKKEEIVEGLNYFLFFKFYRNYYDLTFKNDSKKVAKLAQLIDLNKLGEQDSKLFKKMKFKLINLKYLILLFRFIRN